MNGYLGEGYLTRKSKKMNNFIKGMIVAFILGLIGTSVICFGGDKACGLGVFFCIFAGLSAFSGLVASISNREF